MSFTLFQGDALEVMETLQDHTVKAVIVDPPYGIDYQSNRRVVSDKLDKIQNDTTPFLGWAEQAYRITSADGCILCFYRWDVQEAFVSELSDAGWLVKSQVIWNKMVHGTGDLKGEFAPQHENILFARKPGFSFPGSRPFSIISYPRVGHQKLLHPNQKPVGLIRHLIEAVSSPGEAILDFTMGSGSTGVAAVLSGRDFIGIDVDVQYFSIAQERIKNAAGEFELTAKERATGQLGLFKGE